MARVSNYSKASRETIDMHLWSQPIKESFETISQQDNNFSPAAMH